MFCSSLPHLPSRRGRGKGKGGVEEEEEKEEEEGKNVKWGCQASGLW